MERSKKILLLIMVLGVVLVLRIFIGRLSAHNTSYLPVNSYVHSQNDHVIARALAPVAIRSSNI